MGLYNMLHGVNENGGALLAALGLTADDFARFRDVWVDGAEQTICVYTRLGGGNRECYCDDHAANPRCYQATIESLQAHPLYARDYDDDFDTTYATFVFRWPAEPLEVAAALRAYADQQGPPISGDERWSATFKALGINKPT